MSEFRKKDAEMTRKPETNIPNEFQLVTMRFATTIIITALLTTAFLSPAAMADKRGDEQDSTPTNFTLAWAHSPGDYILNDISAWAGFVIEDITESGLWDEAVIDGLDLSTGDHIRDDIACEIGGYEGDCHVMESTFGLELTLRNTTDGSEAMVMVSETIVHFSSVTGQWNLMEIRYYEEGCYNFAGQSKYLDQYWWNETIEYQEFNVQSTISVGDVYEVDSWNQNSWSEVNIVDGHRTSSSGSVTYWENLTYDAIQIANVRLLGSNEANDSTSGPTTLPLIEVLITDTTDPTTPEVAVRHLYSEWGGLFGFFLEPETAEQLVLATSWYRSDDLPDLDGDGVPDWRDAFPDDAREWADTDGDGLGDNSDVDDDGDGVLDTDDAFPLDPDEWSDLDSDGIGDNEDLDDDGDGYSDEMEIECGSDAADADSLPTDTDSDGACDGRDLDDDGDGYGDSLDEFPLDASEWADADHDGIGDNADEDDDGDGWADDSELACESDPLDARSQPADFDGDGLCDEADTDDDGDRWADTVDAFPYNEREWFDTDGDGYGDNSDPDDDNDGWNDVLEHACFTDARDAADFPNDADWDQKCDGIDPDDDNDGVPDEEDAFPYDPFESKDTDGDGIGDNSDLDDDGDGIFDHVEKSMGTDPKSADSDGDSHPDNIDAFPNDPDSWKDSDSDGVGDEKDILPSIERYDTITDIVLDITLILVMVALAGVAGNRLADRRMKVVKDRRSRSAIKPQTSAVPHTPAAAYSDAQLRARGWTQSQIDWLRGR